MRKHWQRRVKCYFNQPAHKKLRVQRRAAKAAAAGVSPLSKLRPIGYGQTRRYAAKVKFGRGFSLAELKAAKITPAFAQTVGIAVDHRRHNKNADTMAANVARLNQYKAKLILFPRVADKPKKGERSLIQLLISSSLLLRTQPTESSLFQPSPRDARSRSSPLR